MVIFQIYLPIIVTVLLIADVAHTLVGETAAEAGSTSGGRSAKSIPVYFHD